MYSDKTDYRNYCTQTPASSAKFCEICVNPQCKVAPLSWKQLIFDKIHQLPLWTQPYQSVSIHAYMVYKISMFHLMIWYNVDTLLMWMHRRTLTHKDNRNYYQLTNAISRHLAKWVSSRNALLRQKIEIKRPVKDKPLSCALANKGRANGEKEKMKQSFKRSGITHILPFIRSATILCNSPLDK